MMNTSAAIALIAAMIIMIQVNACPVITYINGSCCEVKSNEFKFSTTLKSRVYNITNFCGDCEAAAEGYCDATTDGGGWLVIQRRQDGSVDFNRGWVDYEDGFGALTGEFWYGLRPLHCLTKQGHWKLRVDFTYSNGTASYISYNKFAVGPANTYYQLSISGFTGLTSSDPMGRHPLNSRGFSTKDRGSSTYCAIKHHDSNAGGWWYKGCSELHPNHQYNSSYSMYLYPPGKWYALPFIEIKIKPSDCSV